VAGAGAVAPSGQRDGGLRVVQARRNARDGAVLQLGLAAACTHLGLPADAIGVTPMAI